MERRNQGTEASDVAGRRGPSNMAGVERGRTRRLEDCEKIAPRQNDADGIRHAFHQQNLHPSKALSLFRPP